MEYDEQGHGSNQDGIAEIGLDIEEGICPFCNKPYNSEYHMSDECVQVRDI